MRGAEGTRTSAFEYNHVCSEGEIVRAFDSSFQESASTVDSSIGPLVRSNLEVNPAINEKPG
jgi:hypothetical protein